MSRKNKSRLITDDETDFLFRYFVDESKINDAHRDEYDQEIGGNVVPKKAPSKPATYQIESSTEQKELPDSVSESSESEEIEVSDSGSGSRDSDKSSISISESSKSSIKTDSSKSSSVRRSPYGLKIAPNMARQSERAKSMPSEKKQSEKKSYVPAPTRRVDPNQLLGPSLVADVERYIETPEERRARSREVYANLQDIAKKYPDEVCLSRHYSIDDDPDEMEAEYKMHKDRRDKRNQVKFYKGILLNIVSGVEFVNGKYNPFEFKLKDWSKQVATELDDYTEVLEEIYEKYKDKGGKMAPEFKLLMMIVFSGVTFHVSGMLFGSEGLGSTIKSNPNMIGQLLGGLMKGGNPMEPSGAKEAPPNSNAELLARIKSQQNKKKTTNEPIATETTERQSATKPKENLVDANLAMEREKRKLAEQKAAFEAQSRKQAEMYSAQLQQIQSQLSQQPTHIREPVASQGQIRKNNASENRPRNIVLNNNDTSESVINIPFGSEFNSESEVNISFEEPKSVTKNPKSSIKKPVKFDEIIDSLSGSTDDDIEAILSNAKNKSKKTTTTKPLSSLKKPTNRSLSKNTSDGLSTLSRKRRTNNIINL